MLKNLVFAFSIILYASFSPACSSAPLAEETVAENSRPASLHSSQKIGDITLFRYHYGTVESTQEAAKNHQENLDKTHWSLTTADTHTKNFTYEKEKSIFPKGTFFATYSLPFSQDLIPRFSLLAPTIGLAMVDTLKALGIEEESIGLQWPHTPLVFRQTIGNCLIRGDGQALQITVGLGIETEDDGSPSKTSFTSLEEILKSKLSKETVLQTLTNSLLAQLESFLNRPENLIQTYRDALVDIGGEVTVLVKETNITGIFTGVNDKGFLLLNDNSDVRVFPTGRIVPW